MLSSSEYDALFYSPTDSIYVNYVWVGQIRTVNISKGSVFCYYENIENYADYVFNKLKEENYLINADNDAIFDRFSFYMSEINALHPFREGHGRSQRVFMSYLTKVAGYELNFEEITQEKMIELSSLDLIMGMKNI